MNKTGKKSNKKSNAESVALTLNTFVTKFPADFRISKSAKLFSRKLRIKQLHLSRKVYLSGFLAFNEWKRQSSKITECSAESPHL